MIIFLCKEKEVCLGHLAAPNKQGPSQNLWQVEYEGERYRITSMNVIAKNCKLENPDHAIFITLDDLIKKGKYNKPMKKEEKGEQSVAG